MSRIITAIPLLILLGLSVLMAQKLLNHGKVTLIDKPAPDFSVPNFEEGQPPFTQADLEGRPALVVFFATWCPVCLIEHPNVTMLARKYGLPVYAIAYRDDRQALAQFLHDSGNPYQKIGFDEKGDSYFAWGVGGMPESFLVDGKGRIRLHHVGMIREDDITGQILPAIAAIKKEQKQ